MASQITSPTIVYSTIYSGADQSSAPLAFVRGIHRWPVNSPHKGPVTRKMFEFDDVIVVSTSFCCGWDQQHFRHLKWSLWQYEPTNKKILQSHDLETLFYIIGPLPAVPAIDGFPHRGPFLRVFDVFFMVNLNKLLNQQSNYQWFQTASGAVIPAGCRPVDFSQT